MSEEQVTRKLAAILYADVAGYSRLTATDEENTHRILSAYLDAITILVQGHGGRILHYAGDAVLAEFNSAITSVKCAIEIQEELAARNAVVQADRKVEFRIGINLGDVIADRDELYGDGVNVAARLEGLAEPGGICISASVFEQVNGKLNANFQDMGPRDVKNLPTPVRAYTVVSELPYAAFNYAPAIPNKPSIAVLPFENISGDPEQEFFADGMTEDIITGLSRFRSLFVIARGSSFSFKGQAIDIREIARKLGVRYLLEGSVRAHGPRIRVSAQLIDAETGNHIWAEQYDREQKDIFLVQDEVTEAIVSAIAPEIGSAERERAQRKSLESVDAWSLYQRGLAAYYASTGEGHRTAIELFDRVTQLDPSFAPAYAMASTARTRYLMHFLPDNRDELLNEAREKAHMAITLDPQDSTCLWCDGRVLSLLGRHDVAIPKVQEAVALNPNDAMSRYVLGTVLCSAGRAEEAIPHIDHAIRLSPRDVFLTGMLFHRALVLFDLEKYDEAFEWVQRASLGANPRPLTFALLAAVSIRLGRRADAQAALDALLIRAPGVSCSKYQNNPMFGGPEVLERFIDALRQAGLPE